MVIEQAIQLTKSIAPKYPLGYTEVYGITLSYLQECRTLRSSYSSDELDRRIRAYCTRGD